MKIKGYSIYEVIITFVLVVLVIGLGVIIFSKDIDVGAGESTPYIITVYQEDSHSDVKVDVLSCDDIYYRYSGRCVEYHTTPDYAFDFSVSQGTLFITYKNSGKVEVFTNFQIKRKDEK